MVKKIDNVMQSIASEAYQKTARRAPGWSVTGEEEPGSFKREYLQALVRDYFYSGHQSDTPKEKLGHLQKLKASIDSLQLPADLKLTKSSEEISLGSFVHLLEEEMAGFEENKAEKIKEEEKKLKELTPEEMENVAAKAKDKLTLGDVEKYRHGQIKTERLALPPEMNAQIKKHFENQGITPTPEHEVIAKNLLEKGVELSETVCANIDALIQAKNKELSQDRVEELARQYAAVQKIDLAEWNREFPLSPDRVKEIVDELAGLEDDYQQRIGTSFHTIEEALDNYRQNKAAAIKQPVSELSRSQISFQYIRYKMTLEKAITLNSRGIPIDKTELVMIEKELLRLELTAENLEQAVSGSGQTEDAVLTEMLDVEHAMMNVMGSDYGSVAQMMTAFSLKQISGMAAANQAVMAIHRYDALGTQVRPSLGDSMNKAFYRLNSLLLANGIEATEANLRAAEILGRGQAEINEQSIDRIKEIDQKLQLVLRGLTPETVLERLAAGQDMLELSLDELAALADQRESKDLRKLSDRVARKINQLEKSGKLVPEDREQLISFYRLLHTIEKSEGGAAAFLLRDGRTVNLENLYDAAKYLRDQTSIDAKVTAETGFLESNDFIDLKEQIKKGFLERKREIRETLRAAEESLLGDAPEDSAGEKLELLKSYSLRELEALFNAFKQPSMRDAEIYKEFQKMPFLWSDSLRRLEKTAENNEKAKQKLDALKKVLTVADQPAAGQDEKIRQILKDLEADLIAGSTAEEKEMFSSLLQAKKQWEYGKCLQDRHEFMQIPLWINGNLRQINLYYPQDKQAEARERGELKTLISFETAGTGKVSGFLQMSPEKGELLLQADLAATENAFKAKKEEFCQIFREAAFPLTSLAVGSFAELTPFHEAGKDPRPVKQAELLTAGEEVPAAETTLQAMEEKLPQLAKALAGLLYQIESAA